MFDKQRINKNNAKRDAVERLYKIELSTEEPSLHQETISSTILGYMRNDYTRISIDSYL